MRELKVATPEELLAMRPSTLGTWAALWNISPGGPDRADLGHAMTALQVARSGLKKPGNAPWKLRDFLPFAPPEDEGKTLAQKAREALMALPGRRKKR